LKIVIVSNYAPSLVNFRYQLLQAFVSKGHEVIAIAPKADAAVVTKLEAISVAFEALPIQSAELNPLNDWKSYRALSERFKALQPDMVFAYTIKPVIYGSIAAHRQGVKHIYSMITGLGSGFIGESLKYRLIKKVITRLYRIALKKNEKVFFQNADDLGLFVENKMVKMAQTTLVNGSGVDLDYYQVEALPKTPRFLMLARLLKDKGICEYVEAARQVKAQYPEAQFDLAGDFSDNPSVISPQTIDEWQKEGVINYLGHLDDVRPTMATASVFVLPSYREGTPRSVLEAMAMGRAIITTDVPGCCETVVDGVNGFLVPAKDSEALAKAMVTLLQNPALAVEMGQKSREMAENRYDVHKVNQQMLKAMSLC
jgi:glycosyltransferase involved in cell wall biosynthesis